MLHAGALHTALVQKDERRATQVVQNACHEADVRLRSPEGHSALHLAARQGFAELCHWDIDHLRGAFGGVSGRFPGRHLGGHLLDCPFFVQAEDLELQGRSALHLAALHGRSDACYVLLEHPHFRLANGVDFGGHTALHLAASSGQLAACEVLLRHGGFVAEGQRQQDGMSALHLAARQGHAEVCQLLLSFEGCREVAFRPDHFGRTVLGQGGQVVGAGVAVRQRGLRQMLAKQALERDARPMRPGQAMTQVEQRDGLF